MRTYLKQHYLMLTAALVAMAWTIARAHLQSITLDEADSYLLFAGMDWPAHWYPSSGNHVLNTILERAFTTVFGLTHLTVRGPALIGAAIYIASSYALAVHISAARSIHLPLFLCLIYNPFVMDYMAAARGYGLALGFLMAAVWALSKGRCAAASVCAGLSICANFSFAYINAVILLVFTVATIRQKKNWRNVVLCLIPGSVVAFLICGWTLLNFPRSQLYYGADHLTQMWQSMIASTFGTVNPFIVNPMVEQALSSLRPVILFMVVALLIFHTLRIVFAQQPLGLILIRTIAIAVLCHWLAHRFMKIPLPMERTAIFFVPLAILVLGIGAALPARVGIYAWPRYVSVAALVLSAAYFIGCLRVSYFKEWKFDADVKEVYSMLRYLHRRDGIREFVIDWRYSSPFNFYRAYFHDEGINSFSWHEPWDVDKRVYVLYYPNSENFIQSQNLSIIYRGKVSDVVVAVRVP